MVSSQFAVALGLAVACVGTLRTVTRRGRTTACQSSPPILPKKTHYVPFGDVPGQFRGDNPMETLIYLKDEYFHARDDTRKDPKILEHVRKENAYTKHMTQHLDDLNKELYEELLSHVQETDAAYPYPYGKYLYFTRTEKGSSYMFHCRKSADGKEVILDENELAKGKTHCEVRAVSISPDHGLLAYSVDFKGDETYDIYFKELSTGTLLADKIEKTTGAIAWGASRAVVFYSTFDEAHRPDKVWRHKMKYGGGEAAAGADEQADELLLWEDDTLFNASFGKTRSGKYLVLGSASIQTSEYYTLDLEVADAWPHLVAERRKGVDYSVRHHGKFFYIVTNQDNAVNLKLMRTNVATPSCKHWTDVFPYDAGVKIDDVDCFKDHMVIYGRQGGFTQMWVVKVSEEGRVDVGSKHQITFEEPIYTLGGAPNKEWDTTKPCPNYNRSLYVCERLEAVASDGTRVPMSMIYRKDKSPRSPSPSGGLQSQPMPIHLYGYGSYEISVGPGFTSNVLPLLDRGVAHVVAHIRGGGEMGRSWYQEGKFEKKSTTFTDFIACAEHLIRAGVTSPNKLVIEGHSAGGLLIGAVLNMRPELFRAAIAGVPFVDLMVTMSDASIPLTTGEWEEWGNPNEERFFFPMLAYSPMDNVRRQAYPAMLVTSGLFDPRVPYWEPTKWVAKLREHKTDDNPLLLKICLETGHFSASDRYHYLREKAFDLAFFLDQLGLSGLQRKAVANKKVSADGVEQ
eukprot:jgi/Mesvir1/20454/Mv12349-RA.2